MYTQPEGQQENEESLQLKREKRFSKLQWFFLNINLNNNNKTKAQIQMKNYYWIQTF